MSLLRSSRLLVAAGASRVRCVNAAAVRHHSGDLTMVGVTRNVNFGFFSGASSLLRDCGAISRRPLSSLFLCPQLALVLLSAAQFNA